MKTTLLALGERARNGVGREAVSGWVGGARRILCALGVGFFAFALLGQPPAQQKLTPLTNEGYNKLIADHKGHVVLVNFWATYCVPCRAEIPEMVKMVERLHAHGLDFVSVSADDAAQEPQARKFITPLKVPGPLYIKSATDDDKYAAAIHAKWEGELPASFIYDRSGRKVGAFIGEVPMKNIEDVVAKFL